MKRIFLNRKKMNYHLTTLKKAFGSFLMKMNTLNKGCLLT